MRRRRTQQNTIENGINGIRHRITLAAGKQARTEHVTEKAENAKQEFARSDRTITAVVFKQ
jgi:hypothetical protein